MKTVNRNKIIFWIATGFIIFVEGVGNLLGVFAITIPVVPAGVKEWAYAGIAFNTIFAIISYWAVKGFGADLVFPVILLSAIVVSYVFYHKLDADKN